MDSITKLKETFQQHHKQYLIDEAVRREKHAKEFGTPYPSFPGDDFCISEALAYMCLCIECCMKKIGENK